MVMTSNTMCTRGTTVRTTNEKLVCFSWRSIFHVSVVGRIMQMSTGISRSNDGRSPVSGITWESMVKQTDMYDRPAAEPCGL